MSGLAIQKNSAHGEAQDYEVRICQNSGFAHGTKNIMKKRLLYISKEKICRSPRHNKILYSQVASAIEVCRRAGVE